MWNHGVQEEAKEAARKAEAKAKKQRELQARLGPRDDGQGNKSNGERSGRHASAAEPDSHR